MHPDILDLPIDILGTVSCVYRVVFSSFLLPFPNFVSPVSSFP